VRFTFSYVCISTQFNSIQLKKKKKKKGGERPNVLGMDSTSLMDLNFANVDSPGKHHAGVEDEVEDAFLNQFTHKSDTVARVGISGLLHSNDATRASNTTHSSVSPGKTNETVSKDNPNDNDTSWAEWSDPNTSADTNDRHDEKKNNNSTLSPNPNLTLKQPSETANNNNNLSFDAFDNANDHFFDGTASNTHQDVVETKVLDETKDIKSGKKSND
ncbi:hypothetical protein RFI_27923, partial [Reticulomyxa filosa]